MKAKFVDSIGSVYPRVSLTAETAEEDILLKIFAGAKGNIEHDLIILSWGGPVNGFSSAMVGYNDMTQEIDKPATNENADD